MWGAMVGLSSSRTGYALSSSPEIKGEALCSNIPTVRKAACYVWRSRLVIWRVSVLSIVNAYCAPQTTPNVALSRDGGTPAA